jgi:hypothetical protein
VELPAEFNHAIYPLEVFLDLFPCRSGATDAAHFIFVFINGPFSALVFAIVAAAVAFARHVVYASPQVFMHAPFVGEHAATHVL